jgi:adenylate cyclase
VVAELRRALGAGIEHTPRGRAVRPEVWELLVQGRAQVELTTPGGLVAGRDLLSRCVALDAGLVPAWVELGHAEYMMHFYGMGEGEHLEQGLAHLRHALELDPEEPLAHSYLGIALAVRGDREAAVSAGRHSLELAPGRADLRLGFATLLNFAGLYEEAIPVLRSLTRLDPAQRYMHLFQIAVSYRPLGRVDEAIAKYRESLQLAPDFFAPHMILAAIHAQLGELNQARAALAELMRLRPDFSIAKIPRLPIAREFMIENLRKAGLRE